MPQALAGTASVIVLHRWCGGGRARRCVCGRFGLCAYTVAVLIFRFNNPDAFSHPLAPSVGLGILVALERGSTSSLLWPGWLWDSRSWRKCSWPSSRYPACFGLSTVCHRRGSDAGCSVGRRLCCFGGVGGVVVGYVEIWPDADRPHVGGTSGDSWIDLVLRSQRRDIGHRHSGCES
jgi:hypothetical protein